MEIKCYFKNKELFTLEINTLSIQWNFSIQFFNFINDIVLQACVFYTFLLRGGTKWMLHFIHMLYSPFAIHFLSY